MLIDVPVRVYLDLAGICNREGTGRLAYRIFLGARDGGGFRIRFHMDVAALALGGDGESGCLLDEVHERAVFDGILQ